jgi:hypothetical protein
MLAKYVSTVTSTVDQRIKEKESDHALASGPSRRLDEMRQKILGQEIVLLNSMRQSLALLAWQPHIGGNFPRALYLDIVAEIQR